MSETPNRIRTPLDEWGQMILPRREGEPIAEYRQRVLQAAPQVTYRDRWTERWLRAREAELSARVGKRVRLRRLTERESAGPGLASVFDFASLEEREETRAFRWPGQNAGGPAPQLLGEETNESGSAGGLVPSRDGERVVATGGAFILDGRLWHLRPRRSAVLSFPEGTGVTALPPWNVSSGHPHRFEVAGEGVLRMIGGDGHVHLLEQRGQVVRQTGGDAPDEHEIETVWPGADMAIELSNEEPPSGPMFLEAHESAPAHPGREAKSLFLSQSEGERIDFGPGEAELEGWIESGWVVADLSGWEFARLSFPSGEDGWVDFGPGPRAGEETLGIGPDLRASKLYLAQSRAEPESLWVRIRVEDRLSGGVEGFEVEAWLEGVSGSKTAAVCSGAAASLRLPTSGEGPFLLSARAEGPEGQVVEAQWEVAAQPKPHLSGYGIDYGNDYGS